MTKTNAKPQRFTPPEVQEQMLRMLAERDRWYAGEATRAFKAINPQYATIQRFRHLLERLERDGWMKSEIEPNPKFHLPPRIFTWINYNLEPLFDLFALKMKEPEGKPEPADDYVVAVRSLNHRVTAVQEQVDGLKDTVLAILNGHDAFFAKRFREIEAKVGEVDAKLDRLLTELLGESSVL